MGSHLLGSDRAISLFIFPLNFFNVSGDGSISRFNPSGINPLFYYFSSLFPGHPRVILIERMEETNLIKKAIIN